MTPATPKPLTDLHQNWQRLVSWSLASLFSTNMAISETKLAEVITSLGLPPCKILLRSDKGFRFRACATSRTIVYSAILYRPHRSTTYVDAAYCYRPSNVACLSVHPSVGLSATLMSPVKTAEQIEMSFGLRTWVGPANHGKGQF